MEDSPKNNDNNESKKSPPKQDYVEAGATSAENRKTWLKLSAWAALLSVAAGIILLALLLSQGKPKDKNISSKQKNNISRENSIVSPKLQPNAGGNSSVTPDDNNNSKYDFPPKNLTKETANPGGIYENRLAVSEEPLVDEKPMLKFMPLRLDLSSSQPTGKFWIRNDGRPDLTFHLTPDNSQIKVSPATGRLKTNQTIYITVTATNGGKVVIDTNGGYDNVKVDYQP
ncbi:MAG TPA: hypothetical protein ENH19_00855 [Actinobacteria bacterium]|nr:hypothetical protein [Actinomycetes bacterium]HEX21186.1 hypothetical protein [Actinomycetota bacterium]